MAIYKPTDCVPSGQSFDATNNRPIFVECKIDTNNAIVNGYSLEFFDAENNRIFPEDSADIHDINHITLISDLKAFFDANFSAYGKEYTDLNTGINGSYLKIPILFDEATPSNTFANNVPVGILDNGGKYRWRITLYQELVASGGVTYPTDLKYYDMIVASGKVLGSTNERIQTALVADDEDLVSGLVLIDKYIQPVKISNLDYDPNFPKEWENSSPIPGVDATIENTASRVLIENYDDIYGHIYPAKSGDNSFSKNDITPEVSNGFRVYKNGNNPENLGVTDKVYEIINYQVDEGVWEYETINVDLKCSRNTIHRIGSRNIVDNHNDYIYGQSELNLNNYYFVSMDIINKNTEETVIDNNEINSVQFVSSSRVLFRINNSESNPNPDLYIYYGLSDIDKDRYFYNLSMRIYVKKKKAVVGWQWINTPANPSQSYWEQTYTTTTNPANGYYPFEKYSQSDINTMVFYGKERVIFNHMQTGGAYSGSGLSRIYYGSCYNGIFTPEASSKKISVDGEDENWDVTIKWYRTTDANSWGQLLNKVVYVESGSTQTVESTDGNVNLSPGSNAEITIGSTAGVINQTPFLFVLEKPIRLFNTATEQTKSAEIIGLSDNTYVISLEVGSENISSIDNITIGSVTISRSEYAVIINTTKIIYTPSGSPVTGDIKVTYVPYKEQDYTGVIFYNMSVGDGQGVVRYIKPFVGIENKMIFVPQVENNQQIISIVNINTTYWFIKYWARTSLPYTTTDTPYQIRSCYRSGDLNEFGLYDDPRIPVKVYDSLGQEVELEDGKYTYYIPTRAFSVEVEYEQDDYILWESCQWDLYTAEKRLDKFIARDFVTTTSEKYDGRLRFVFYGLDDKQYYILKVTVVTNNGGRFNQDIILYANYGEASTGYDRSTINFNYDDLCVEIDIKESLTNPDRIKDSIIRVYKREIWYYQNEIKKPDGRFRGQNSPWRLIGENALSGCIFKDYCVASGHHYEYLICRDISVPEENDDPEQQTEHWITQEQWAQHLEIDVKYMGWSIVELHNPRKIDNGRITLYDAEAKDVWRFKYNVSSGAQTQNLSKTQQDTLGLYPHVSVGEKNFMSGSVSCLLGREIIQADYHVDHYKYVPERVVGPSEITEGYWTRNIDNDVYNAGGYKEELSRYLYPNYNNDYAPQYINADTLGFRNLTSNQAINMINAWKEIAYSGNNKLIRDEKGRMYIVNILSNGINVNETWNDMPTEISFDWIEVDNTNQISVFENRAIGEIVIDGDNDVDGEGYVPDMRYSGYSGANKVWIKNPQNINGFGIDAFNGCINIMDIYIKYPELDPGETFDYEDLFDWWCTRDFKNSNSNPIHVSNGENGEGVRIFKQVSFNGKYELCSSIGSRDGEDFDDNYHCLNAIPSEYSVNGYKYLQDVGIDLDNLVENSDGTLPGGLFDGCVELANVLIKNGDIGDNAFINITSLKNVIMNNIIIIGYSAFLGCSGIESIKIPYTTTQIKGSAFYNCSALSSITFGDDENGSELDKILGAVFYGCSSLKYITIPKSVSRLGSLAFANCSMLLSVEIKEDEDSNNDVALTLGESIFLNCTSLKTITIPNRVASIGEKLFKGCTSLYNITLPFVGDTRKTQEEYPQYPFGYIFGCEKYGTKTNVEEISQIWYDKNGDNVEEHNITYYLPKSLSYVSITNGNILDGAFYGCSTLNQIEVLENITSIGSKAFKGCSRMSSFIMPNSVEEVGDYAFSESGIIYIHISSNMRNIGEGAFSSCSSLSSILLDAPNETLTIESNAFYDCGLINNVIFYPDTMDGWFDISFGNEYSNPIYYAEKIYFKQICGTRELLREIDVPANTDVPDYSFYNCKCLQTITFESSNEQQTVGVSAFENCENVYYLDATLSHIISIGDRAFAGMLEEGLSGEYGYTLYIPDTVSTIGKNAFEKLGYNHMPTSILIGSGITAIDEDAFKDASIDKVYYRGTLSGWCNIDFGSLRANPLYQNKCDLYMDTDGCASTYELVTIIPNTITNIKSYAFAGCHSIIGIEGEGVNNLIVGDYAFYYCRNFDGSGDEGYNLPYNITYIGDFAFAYTSIRRVYGGYFTHIGACAFTNVTSLNYVDLSDYSVTRGSELPGGLFSGCTNLDDLRLPANITSIGEMSLANCYRITRLAANPYIINDFVYKNNLTSVTIRARAKWGDERDDVPSGMLINNNNLLSIYFEGSTGANIVINSNAFKCNANMHSTTIGIDNSVWTIRPQAFDGYCYEDPRSNAFFKTSEWKLYDGDSFVKSLMVWEDCGGTQKPTPPQMADYLCGFYDDGHPIPSYSEYEWRRIS